MKNPILLSFSLLIAILSFNSCEKEVDTPVIPDNGTYDVRIIPASDLNNKVVMINRNVEIDVFFETFADEDVVQKVKIEVLDNLGNLTDVIISQNVNQPTFSFTENYKFKTKGAVFLRITSSNSDNTQQVEKIIAMHSQIAVGTGMITKVDIHTPREGQVFNRGELVEFKYSLDLIEGFGGRFYAVVIPPPGQPEVMLDEERSLPSSFFRQVSKRFNVPGTYTLLIEAFDQNHGRGAQNLQFIIQ